MSRHVMRFLLVAGAVTSLGCRDLTVRNYANPTPESVQGDPTTALPLLVTGVLRNDRDNMTGYVQGTGILGREVYNYTPTEGRNTSGWLTTDVNNQASFGGVSLWAGPWIALRNIHNVVGLVDAGTTAGLFSAAQGSAANGFAHTMEALQLLYLVNTRHDLGIPVDVYDDATQLAPFVSRDSALAYITGRLEQGKTELLAGGTTFPFTLHAGYAGFTTPANYLRVNRAIAARVYAYRASLGASGCGAAKSPACYNLALTALTESFINASATTTAQLATGPFNVYSAAASDVANGISNVANTNVVAHARADSGIQLKANGTRDNRYLTKVITIATKNPSNSSLGIPSTFDYSIYLDRASPVPTIRNEELILLRAEARWYTGDAAGALADINLVRTVAGGLDPVGAFANEAAFLDELLYNRRLSLVFEGHRWIDMRRFGRLNLLTLDLPTHTRATQLPVPQAECLSRAIAATELKAPGCI
jgi:hypothetical protein